MNFAEMAAEALELLHYAQEAALVRDSTLQECVECVNSARMAQDRLQVMVADVQLQKVKTFAAREDARAVYEDAWGKASTGGRVGFVEYSSAKERDAAVDTKVMAEKFAVRKVEKEHGMVMAFLDVLKTYVSVAESIRREGEFRVRAITLMSQLER